MIKRSKAFAAGTCAVCGLYTCAHLALVAADPSDTKRDATVVVALTTATGGALFSRTTYDPTYELERRVDMPKIISVTIKATKPSG